ncbi:shikimate dehydrogenase [Corynebacterium kozikiae]|uniref:shikimate dehydrogenase n=1 Tax=Corynebacterium kozikiae TaxID=2968469 RepID=UPI00211C0889|nr:shikimate dehydrogenase [Corynebacterium sp. 76QC2CO]MCQ9342773.1 shikimate dehydrogenase [Corynebacterium sp. 76QC2CO]
MPKAAVLGSPIGHSLSPVLHNAGYRAAGLEGWSFERAEVTEETFAEFLAEAGEQYAGFAVTMPCKFAAFRAADTHSERALALGVANTLVRSVDGTEWAADNTDVDGVRGALAQLLPEAEGDALAAIRGAQVAVTGSGGTARTVVWTLAQLGAASIRVINRSDRLAELKDLVAGTATQLEYQPAADPQGVSRAAQDSLLVVSTVPSAGIAHILDELAQAPVFDVIYDPWPTPLVQRAQERNLPTVGGHIMLAHQAFTQFEAITGTPAPKEAMLEALQQSLT